MITQGELLNAARCFDANETRVMRDAYACASEAFSFTHRSSADLETKLASIVLFIYTSEKVARRKRRVDVLELAEESLDVLVRFTNAESRPFGSAEYQMEQRRA